MSTTEPITTAVQLLRHPDLGRCELVRGELRMMSPAGAEHSGIATKLTMVTFFSLRFLKERNAN